MKRTLLFLFAFISFAADAMKVEVHGNTIYASGPVEDDIRKFTEATEAPGVGTVVLINSPGGDLWTGIAVGRLIANRGLNTVIAGNCSSACSIMFMGGKERTFSDAFHTDITFIGIHGAHDRATKLVNQAAQPQIFAFYKQQMSERFNSAVMNTALYNMEDSGSMLRIFDAARSPVRPPYHCKSSQTLRKDCTEFKEFDAFSLGIVTTNVLTKVVLPASYKEAPQIFGQALNQSLLDQSDYLDALSAQQCNTETCRNLVTNYLAIKEHKALATPIAAKGLGTASNRPTALSAFLGALYACNHVKGNPARLCEVKTVDGYDLRDHYTASVASHSQAIARLAAPLQNFYANEEFGGGFSSAAGMRTQKLHDMTPKSLDGIKTVSTQELARALMSSRPPILIDVWAGTSEAIPGSVTLFNGGQAFDDVVAEKEYESRFAGLLKLLSPTPDEPVIFYCMSRECWLSVNASLRAHKLGYSRVGWYRGGLESWKAANLPLAPVIVKAVAR